MENLKPLTPFIIALSFFATGWFANSLLKDSKTNDLIEFMETTQHYNERSISFLEKENKELKTIIKENIPSKIFKSLEKQKIFEELEEVSKSN